MALLATYRQIVKPLTPGDNLVVYLAEKGNRCFISHFNLKTRFDPLSDVSAELRPLASIDLWKQVGIWAIQEGVTKMELVEQVSGNYLGRENAMVGDKCYYCDEHFGMGYWFSTKGGNRVFCCEICSTGHRIDKQGEVWRADGDGIKFELTRYSDGSGSYPAIQLPWDVVTEFLGEHEGEEWQDIALVTGLLNGGAPLWVKNALRWTDEYGWGVYDNENPIVE